MRMLSWVMRNPRRYAAALRSARLGAGPLAAFVHKGPDGRRDAAPGAVAGFEVDGLARRAAAGHRDVPGMVGP